VPQTRIVEKTALTGFVTVLALLGLVGVVTQRTILGLIDDNRWVTHTHVVLETFQRLSYQISQAEAAARGYVLTGDPRFEAQYKAAKISIPDLVSELRNQTADNPIEQARIPALQEVIGERLQVLENSVQIRRTQGLAAVLAIKNSRGPYLSSEITEQMELLRGEENRLLAARNLKAQQSSRRAFAVLLISVVLAMTAVAASVFLIFRDLRRRREVDRMKSEFVSVVSHELRTPLTSLRGSLGLLGSGLIAATTEKGKRMLEIAVDNTDRLIRLINDILDVEKLDSGGIQMNRKLCSGGELIKQAADAMRSMAHTHNITLQTSETDALISADPDRVVQCLTNLISNAIKFSDGGGIVTVRAVSGGGELRFEVSDRGRGIPAAYQTSIFERFHQVDASDSRKKGGTGLGLAISRSIVRQHGGRIWVESQLGKGSTFFFTIPLTGAESGADSQPTASDGSNAFGLQRERHAETRLVD
jgi:signal transduction histidine kinase